MPETTKFIGYVNYPERRNSYTRTYLKCNFLAGHALCAHQCWVDRQLYYVQHLLKQVLIPLPGIMSLMCNIICASLKNIYSDYKVYDDDNVGNVIRGKLGETKRKFHSKHCDYRSTNMLLALNVSFSLKSLFQVNKLRISNKRWTWC